MRKLPPSKIKYGPFEVVQTSFQGVAAFVLFRPILFAFTLMLVLLVYAAMNNRKVQNALLSLPYERFYQIIKSNRMVTFYATVVEVVFELITVVILAGVSIIITSWLLIEEAADRKHEKVSLSAKNCGSIPFEVMESESEEAALENELQKPPSPMFSQHTYFISPNPSRTS